VTGGLTRFARRWWAGSYGWAGTALSLALLPASGLWRAVTAWRNRLFDRKGGVFVEGARIVSVGNLAVGGTGKTPLASWVASALAEDGRYRPALLLRGYGSDEVLLHRSWTPDVPVLAVADRAEGAGAAVRAGATAIVLDDGFQHRRLIRDVDVVLLAVEDPWPPRVLPRGPYREPASALGRAHAIVLTRRSASGEDARARAGVVTATPGLREGVTTACVRIVTSDLQPLSSEVGVPRQERREPAGIRGALALTAIARPHAFRDDVARYTEAAVELMAYGDHHHFTARDARAARVRAGDRPVVVTEKDAVKLRRWVSELGETWVLRQRLEWDWGEEALRALVTGSDEGSAGVADRGRSP
jgi:tetraacyldisaccharide 4'-kinase